MTTVVFVCRKCDGGRQLAAHLAERTDADVRLVGCQKICSHHVVGIRPVGSRLSWFEKVDTKGRRRAVRDVVASGLAAPLPKPLRRLTVDKRADRLR